MLTLRDRVESYKRAFPDWPASWPIVYVDAETGRETIQGIWCFGQDYRNQSEYYGAYPGNFIDRLAALFPEFTLKPDMLPMGDGRVLHAFSGSLAPGPYVRCDVKQDAEYRCDVCDLPAQLARDGSPLFDFIAADPPYSDDDAAKYQTMPLNRQKATSALAQVARPGAYVCWLDTVWPMHSKEELVTVGQIFVRRSTNHRIRLLTIFERVA